MPHNLLKGKKGIIFGALNEQSLAWKTALKCCEEGAEIVLTNTALALRMGTLNQLAEITHAPIIPADITNEEDLKNLFDKTMEHFGGKFDFILHSVGMSVNMRKGKPYTDLNHEWEIKTLDISALSLHKVLQIAYEKNALNEWASVVALTYIAAQRIFPDYSEMADAKALLESIARSFGYHYGIKNKVRINTVSQSPTMTTAGSGVKGFDKFVSFADKMSPLGNAPAEAFADYCVTLFSDLTRYVTMQNLYHDGGYSSTGVSQNVIEQMG
jgi:enoyl-[acyl-carrier protein] reductase I